MGLGIGLAMDAFSVSLANGLHEPGMKWGRMSVIAGVYAAFQFAMPMAGWLCVHTIVEMFSAFERLIPWIALVLLAYIGGKMIREGLEERNQPAGEAGAHVSAAGREALGGATLLLQGIATSIDALSVGFTIESYTVWLACAASAIIGLVTYLICLSGLQIGKKAGTYLSWKASVLGGAILIAIGIEIFIKRFLPG